MPGERRRWPGTMPIPNGSAALRLHHLQWLCGNHDGRLGLAPKHGCLLISRRTRGFKPGLNHFQSGGLKRY